MDTNECAIEDFNGHTTAHGGMACSKDKNFGQFQGVMGMILPNSSIWKEDVP